MDNETNKIYEFSGFRLLLDETILLHAGEPVTLRPKAFAALSLLVERHGHLVEKSELIDKVWGGAFIEEAAVSRCIWELRSALGRDPNGGRFIQTIPKRGYRFVVEVRVTTGNSGPILIENSNGHARLTEKPGTTSGEKISLGTSHSSEIPLLVSDNTEETTVSNAAEPAPASLSPAVRKRGFPVFLVGGLFAVAASLFAVTFLFPPPGKASATVNVSSLAILPLKPVVSENRDSALEFAIVESLILKISEAKDLNVKRLYAVRRFTDLEGDPVEAGRELRVDHVLSSNYQVSEGKVRVTSHLINVQTGQTEQTFRSETKAGDVFAVQDTVSNEIGNALFTKLGRSSGTYAPKRGTDNEQAYTLYHEALYLVDQFDLRDAERAIGLLDKAVKIDPNFGPAWATRAQAFCEYAHFGGGPPVELFDRSAEPSLEKALSINSDDPVALAIRGMVNRDYRWKFAEAYNDLHRAIALDPNYTLAHRILSSLYYSDGKFSEAVEEQKKAVDLNPTGIIDKWFLADLLVNVGRTEEGVNLLHQLTEIDPSSTAAYYSLWRFYHSQHDEIRAFENFLNLNKAAGASPAILKSLRTTYANKGWKQVLKSELERARSSDPRGRYSHSKVYIARLATMLGEKDLAFAYLEEGRRFHDLEFCTVKVDPNFASLRSDPRFAELIKRSGI